MIFVLHYELRSYWKQQQQLLLVDLILLEQHIKELLIKRKELTIMPIIYHVTTAAEWKAHRKKDFMKQLH